jgi:hypothetical protein
MREQKGNNKIELYSITSNLAKPNLTMNINFKGFWNLQDEEWCVKFETNFGNFKLKLLRGWVTDKRSGNSAVDLIIPKWSHNIIYCATVAFHDAGYSGYLPKEEVDELFYQGLLLSGISKWRAKLAWKAVSVFGNNGYFDIEDKMPMPYTYNRSFERFELADK